VAERLTNDLSSFLSSSSLALYLFRGILIPSRGAIGKATSSFLFDVDDGLTSDDWREICIVLLLDFLPCNGVCRSVIAGRGSTKIIPNTNQ
jgi:hypothetical protein